jgi:mRNA interferase MazF
MADLGIVAKVRPVLILSVEYQDNERAVVTYVIRTTSIRGTQYEVLHETRGMLAGGFDAQGIASIPDVKLERPWGSLMKRHSPRLRKRCVLGWGSKTNVLGLD